MIVRLHNPDLSVKFVFQEFVTRSQFATAQLVTITPCSLVVKIILGIGYAFAQNFEARVQVFIGHLSLTF